MRRISEKELRELHLQWEKASQEIKYRSIGYIESEFEHSLPKDMLDRCYESRIVLHKNYSEGLTGLRFGKRLRIFYHFPEGESQHLLQHPNGDKGRPLRGVFGLDTPFRPNPVQIAEVELMAIADHVLWVKGLCALNGTPVLDIKPVSDRFGRTPAFFRL